MNKAKLFLSASIFLLSGAAHAGEVTIKDGWIRTLPGNTPAGGYFTLLNGTAKSITLTGVSSPSCGEAMLHESKSDGGMKSMAHVASIPVAAGGSVSFAPGGYHIMCMMPVNLIPGGKADVTLIFADGSKRTASFAVKDAKGR